MAFKIADLFVKLSLKDQSFDKGIDKAKKKTMSFGDSMKKIGGLIAGAFAVERIISFGAELSRLGGEAEGVRAAFERIGGDKIISDLEAATAGTVSRLELMKKTVQASNFQIPIENLASLFEFASKRAQETGESVDYLVNSIVLGIGRKSPLILDNLGISAVRLRQELKGAGVELNTVQDIAAAVGRIAAGEMEKSGKIIETNAIKIQQLKKAWSDWKLELSESQGLLDLISNTLEDIMITGTIITSDQLSGWQKIKSILFDSREEAVALAKSLKDSSASAAEMGPFLDDMSNTFQEFKIPEFFDNPELTEEIKKNWEKLNEEFKLSQMILSNMDDLFEKVSNSALKASNAFFMGSGMDVEGAKAIGEEMQGVFGMFSDEEGEDINFDTAARVKFLEDEANFIKEMNAMAESGIEDFVGTFVEGIGQLLSGNVGFQEFFNVILGQLGEFLVMFGKALIAYGIAMEGFKKAFNNPFAAIAAGAALVLIGGVISGLASSAPSTSGGGGASGVGGALNVITTDAQDKQLVAKVSGRDLDFVLTKYTSDRSRR